MKMFFIFTISPVEVYVVPVVLLPINNDKPPISFLKYITYENHLLYQIYFLLYYENTRHIFLHNLMFFYHLNNTIFNLQFTNQGETFYYFEHNTKTNINGIHFTIQD
jgi:hypothetical protein